MARQHINWKRYFTTLLSRNVILCFFINVINNYGNGTKNTVRTMIGMQDVGVDATTIGVLLSVFSIVALIVRCPSGSILDKFPNKMRQILAIYMGLRAVTWLGFMVGGSPFFYECIFTLDGIVNTFVQTALPALLAVSVDRSAMGSAYAIYTGLSTVLTGTSRTVSLSLYESSGRVTVMLVCCLFALAAGALTLCIDKNKMARLKPNPERANAKGFLKLYSGGIHKSLLPLCLVSAIPVIAFTAQSSYSQVWLDTTNFEHLTIDAIGGSLSGVIVVAVGFLCDFVPPSILAIITLAGYSIFPIMMGMAQTQGVYSAALWIFYLTKFYHIPLRIVGMKCVTKREQGSLSSTILLAYDIVAVIGGPVIGWAMDNFGFRAMMIGVGVFGIFGLVSYIVMEFTLLPKIRARSALIEAQEAAEAAQAEK